MKVGCRMQETPENKQVKTVRRRKLKKMPFIILGIILILILASFLTYRYAKNSYQDGIQLAIDHGKKPRKFEFNGAIKNDAKINVLILGQDRMVDGNARTDSIMVAQYDYLNKRMKVVSVMRDIYAEIPGYRNYKINTAYSLGGPELLRKTLKKNLGIDIEYYAIIDFKGFESMVDEIAPNGLPIDVEKDMSDAIGVSLKKGQHNLKGKEVLGYARFRHDDEGDFGRVRRQQQVIKALKKEMTSFSAVTKTPKLAGIARGYVDTNLDDPAIFKTGASFILRGDKDVKTLVVPIKDSYFQNSYPEVGAVLEIDKEKNKAAIQKFLNE